MAEPVKYKFDQAFDGGAKSRFDEELDRVRHDAEAMKSEAYAQGLEDGKNQALHGIEAQTKDALGQVAQAVHALFSQRQQLETGLKQDMVQLAYTIASKLAPALIRQYPMAEIEALIEDCLATAATEPRLVIRVSEQLLDPINEKIEDLKAATGFPGDVVLIAEGTLGPMDCRVEWPDGGSDRKYELIRGEIEAAVQRFVMSETSPADEVIDDMTVADQTAVSQQRSGQ